MRILLAILLTLPALAGCFADDEPAAPEPSVEPDGYELPPALAPGNPGIAPGEPNPGIPQLAFQEAVQLPDYGGAEPNIALLDGTIFVTAPQGGHAQPDFRRGSAPLWRSTNGVDWELIRTPAAATDGAPTVICSCDADVITSGDGWTYYTDWWIALVAGNIVVEASADGGETWTATPITIPTQEAQSIDRQWLGADDDGTVLMLYAQFGSVLGSEGRIETMRSTDHGQTWEGPIAMVPIDGAWTSPAKPAVTPDRLWFMPYGHVRSTDSFWRDPSSVKATFSRDGGQTWTQTDVAQVPGGFDNLWAVQGAADDAGNLYTAYAHRIDDNHTAITLATSVDDGATWELRDIVSEGTHMLPWVSATGDGQVAVGWYGSTFQGDPAAAPADTVWHAFVAESLTHGNDGFIAAVDEVRTGSFCPRGSGCNGDRELLDYFSMEYDDNANLHVAYAKMGGDEAMVWYTRELTAGLE